MPKNWWFKFEQRVWQSDPALSGCSLAARGFWLEMVCVMHNQDSYSVTGTFEELARMARCESNEVAKYATELKTRNAADVTLGHGFVTLVSRRLKRELKARKDNTLRKQKERGHGDVTEKSHDRVKSNKKEVNKDTHTEAGDEMNVSSEIKIDAVDAHTLGYPLADFYKFFPDLMLSPGQMGMILAEVKDTPVDREAWAETIKQYVGNYDRSTKSYLPEKIGNVLSLFTTKRKEIERNGSNTGGNGGRYPAKRTDQDVIAESADFYENYPS